MKRSSKIVFGIVTIFFAFISSTIGFWLMAERADTYTFAMGLSWHFFSQLRQQLRRCW